MSKSNFAIQSINRSKPLEKRPRRVLINTQNREISLENKKLSKKIGLNFSPYASQALQFRSFEKNETISHQGHLTMACKERLNSFQRANRKNSASLNSLIGDERSKSVNCVKISKKLMKRIDELCETSDYIDLYFDVFDEVINNVKDFGKVLNLLKTRFLKIFRSLIREKEDKSSVIKNLEINLESFRNENQKLIKRNKEYQEEIKKISQEFSEISMKYYEIANVEIKDSELSLECLKELKQENIIYQDLMFRLKDELSFYKKKSKKFGRLIELIESKGVPVEEIYLTEMKKSKILPKYDGKSEIESCTENEYLETNFGQFSVKPDFVPSLHIENIEIESSSDDISSSSPVDRFMDL